MTQRSSPWRTRVAGTGKREDLKRECEKTATTLEKKIIYIKGMCCARCIRILKEEISQLSPNKITVKIGQVELEYDGKRITYEQIHNSIEDAGFEIVTLLKEQKIEDVKQYVNNHLSNPEALRLSAISRVMAISPFHLSRTFSLVENETLQGFITRMRMEYAARLLRETERTVMDICLEVGLNSTSHFTMQFKKRFAQSPLAYRKSPRKNPQFFHQAWKYIKGIYWHVRDEVVQHLASIHAGHYPKER